jgi:hypothetical protein
MLTQVDAVLLADNGSVDGTREWLREQTSDRLHVVDDPVRGYYQSQKTSALAAVARDLGAGWVIGWDADEAWFARDGRRIADVLAELPESVRIARADLWDHVATGRDPDDPNPLVRLGWRRADCAPLPKVACRALPGLTIAQGNHGATYDDGDLPGITTNLLTVRHYSYRDALQMIRKVRNGAEAYAATDLPEDQGAHWRQMGRMSDEQIMDAYRTWFWRASPAYPVTIEGERQGPLVHDPAPISCPLPS